MEILLVLVALVVMSIPIGLTGWVLTGQGSGALTQLFGGYKDAGWPQGVQEEDEVHWNWRASAPADGGTTAARRIDDEGGRQDGPAAMAVIDVDDGVPAVRVHGHVDRATRPQ